MPDLSLGDQTMRKAIIASVTTLCAIGMLGGCLILAGNGFITSSKRADWHIFVPAPQAYIMAAIMFALSGIALLWLLQQVQALVLGYALGAAAYIGVAIIITRALH